MSILITGGAGYIGSHVCVELLEKGYEIVVIDNLSNSHFNCINRIKTITRKEFSFYQIDLLDKNSLEKVFQKHSISCVIHFAGLKAVGESVNFPLKYYHNNVMGSIYLFELMKQYDCKKIIFSSTATVYGDPDHLPIKEDAIIKPLNPYGRSKYYIEEILKDISFSEKGWQIGILRYFNPVGAHQSGKIGENPSGVPNNLMPFIAQVAIGKIPKLLVFGRDYPTEDGTGIRDYIHVVDLARGHLALLEKFVDKSSIQSNFYIYNLGCGKGHSVLEMIKTFEKVSKQKIKYEFVQRRAGDTAECYADVTKANKLLKWKTIYTIEDMCADTWHWQKKNPNGFL